MLLVIPNLEHYHIQRKSTYFRKVRKGMGRNEINIKDCQQRKKGSQKQSPKGMFK
jgi:hypothetical protein